MKTIVFLLLVLGTALLGRAAETGAQKKAPAVRLTLSEEEEPSKKPESPKSAPEKRAETRKNDPAAKTTSKKDAGKKKDAAKEDEIGKIDGMEIPRNGDRYLGIQIVGGNFKLGFYDAKKKPVAPDVERAALRWDPKYKLGMERVVLTPGGGPNFLTSEKFVRPPYNFKLTIVLIGGGNAADSEEPAGETHVIDFRQ